MAELSDEQKELRKLSARARKLTPEDRTEEQSRVALRRKVRMFYDLQKLRIQTAGRTYNENRDKDVELHHRDIAILKRRSEDLHWAEKEALKDIEAHLKTVPFYTEYLLHIKGVGPTMAGVMLAEIDIHKCETVSALWRYAGLAPIPCKRCLECKDVVKPQGDSYVHEFKRLKPCALKTVPAEMTYDSAKSEKPKKGEKLHYNKFLHSKLLGVLSEVLLRTGSPYRSFYDNYKHRLVSGNKGRDDGHRHRMALRYMVKMLLLDIHKAWREMEGLPVRPSYQEEYLGHTHHAS